MSKPCVCGINYIVISINGSLIDMCVFLAHPVWPTPPPSLLSDPRMRVIYLMSTFWSFLRLFSIKIWEKIQFLLTTDLLYQVNWEIFWPSLISDRSGTNVSWLSSSLAIVTTTSSPVKRKISAALSGHPGHGVSLTSAQKIFWVLVIEWKYFNQQGFQNNFPKCEQDEQDLLKPILLLF